MPPRPAVFRRTRAAGASRQATIPACPTSGFLARCSRAVRICVRRITAGATARPHVTRSRWTHRRAMWDSAALFVNRHRRDDRCRTAKLGLMPKLVLVLGALLIAAGVLWHGVTVEALDRFWHDLAGRPGWPVAFRFILQASMAAIAAIHDGVKDARAGRAPYWWTVVRNSHDRVERLSEGLTATAR